MSAQLGHATPTMTLNHYARWLPAERREAPSRLEAQLAAAREEVSTSDQFNKIQRNEPDKVEHRGRRWNRRGAKALRESRI